MERQNITIAEVYNMKFIKMLLGIKQSSGMFIEEHDMVKKYYMRKWA